MILLVALPIATITSLLCGGKLRYLAEVRFEKPHFILLSMAIQILIFTPWWQGHETLHTMTNGLYVTSLALLMIACWQNRRIPGMLLLGLGLASNALVILVNGGRMPAFLGALRAAGLVSSREEFEAAHVTNSALIALDTPLWFLGDILAIPKSFPLANVYSIGDVLIAEGALAFVFLNMRGRPAPADVAEEGLLQAPDLGAQQPHAEEYHRKGDAL